MNAEAKVSHDLEREWQATVAQFNPALERYLDDALRDAPSRLSQAIRYSLLAPGKRLRPVLVLWAGQALGAAGESVMPAAMAVEMIHCYSLIHDDLPAMDDDDLRRGRPTCHIQFDEATAILAGDALQPMAFEALVNGVSKPDIAQQACRLLARAAGPAALVGGQADDLLAESEGGDARLLERIHARKTAAMIQVSVELGGLLAGAQADSLHALSTYGRSIGLAFQIVDDLLDVQGDAESLGKRTGKDTQRGKLTYPGFHGIPASMAAASDYTDKAIRAIETWGARGEALVRLAKYILERKH